MSLIIVSFNHLSPAVTAWRMLAVVEARNNSLERRIHNSRHFDVRFAIFWLHLNVTTAHQGMRYPNVT